MLKANFNRVMRLFLYVRMKRLEKMRTEGVALQHAILHRFLDNAAYTAYGLHHGFSKIKSYDQFKKQVPIVTYEDLSVYIRRMMLGEEDVLWPGKVRWFAKSSGTTSDKSKYLPVTDEFYINNLIASSWDTSTIMYDLMPECKAFQGKNLTMCGSLSKLDEFPQAVIGDVSAIMFDRMPSVGRPFMAPDRETALLPNWDEKIARMSKQLIHDDIVLFSGVPTWTIVLFERMLEETGFSDMTEIWPNVATYLHGGVGFEPYRKIFQKYIPKDDFLYLEAYNASEGFFGIQDSPHAPNGMLLLTDNQIFYEFLPMDDAEHHPEKAVPLEGVVPDKNYALVITTSSGLWRYMPGDTVKFTSVNPYRLKVTGRTKHFINVFGEEVMISNTDQALKMACEEFGCIVSEYTVGPRWLEGNKKGGHEWMIEFEKAPLDLKTFELRLDQYLQSVNSDYEAKRYMDMALDNLKVNVLPKGTFVRWLQSKGKSGGQHKVPRLSNSRQYLEEIGRLVGYESELF